MRFLYFPPVAFVLSLCVVDAAQGQVLAPAVSQATTVDGVYAAIGLTKPEVSSFLLIDLPDVTLPGKVQARIASALPGTAWLVLVRGRSGEPLRPAASPPTPALIAAVPFKAGEAAQATVSLELRHTESYTLLALAQGRWFVAQRQVKVAQKVAEVSAAKAARAAKVAAATAPPRAASEASASVSEPPNR